jgi:hypothetical protein
MKLEDSGPFSIDDGSAFVVDSSTARIDHESAFRNPQSAIGKGLL